MFFIKVLHSELFQLDFSSQDRNLGELFCLAANEFAGLNGIVDIYSENISALNSMFQIQSCE